MDLSTFKNSLRITERPIAFVRRRYQIIRDRVMQGGCEPRLDFYRVIDRLISTTAIILRTSYAAVITIRNGKPNGAYIFELSAIDRSFGVSRRSGYRYIFQSAPNHRVTIHETLARESSRKSIGVDEYEIYADGKILIAIFSNKQLAINWCSTQYSEPVSDKCGIGNSLHIHCFW